MWKVLESVLLACGILALLAFGLVIAIVWLGASVCDTLYRTFAKR